MAELVFKEESYQIVGACFEVYNSMGCGFLEAVYHECLELELRDRNIPFRSKSRLKIRYKDRLLEKYYEADFICFDQIILEIKAVSELTDEHTSQLLNYLQATKLSLGILVNFGQHLQLEHKRVALTQTKGPSD